MTSKPFAPKLGNARAKVTAPLMQPQGLQQFTPRQLAGVNSSPSNLGPDGKPKKSKKSSIALALEGNF